MTEKPDDLKLQVKYSKMTAKPEVITEIFVDTVLVFFKAFIWRVAGAKTQNRRRRREIVFEGGSKTELPAYYVLPKQTVTNNIRAVFP
jgi:hypothetical protein